jgi:hypothetical protein
LEAAIIYMYVYSLGFIGGYAREGEKGKNWAGKIWE